MPVESYSTTPASNNAAPPNGFPENMTPASINDCARQLMADLKTLVVQLPWLKLSTGQTLVRNSNTQFQLENVDLTSVYSVGRRVREIGATTVYGVIMVSSFSGGHTVVTVVNDAAANVPTSLTSVDVSALDNNGQQILRYLTNHVAQVVLQGLGLFTFDGDEASAVDGLRFIARAAGGDVQIQADGTSTDINVDVRGKGAGGVKLTGPVTTSGAVTLGGALAMGGFEITNLDSLPSADGVAIPRERGFTGNSLSVSIADDNVVRIDNLTSIGMVIVSANTNAGTQAGNQGVIFFQSGVATSTYMGGTDFAHIAASDTPPAEGGSGGTDAKLNFQADAGGAGGALWVKNRLGATITLRIWPLGNGYTTATITATQL